MDHLYQTEDRDGIRFSWNIWPQSKAEAMKNITPIGCMYTPLKNYNQVPKINYNPVKCTTPCNAILNPHCIIDVNNKTWVCPFCNKQNLLPQSYQEISTTCLPLELHPNSITIEYNTMDPMHSFLPAFLFLVDICIPEDELEHLKQSMLNVLALLPPKTFIGLITFGQCVYIYELISKSKKFPAIHAFNGLHEVTSRELNDTLGIGSQLKNGKVQANFNNPFIVPYETNQVAIETVFESIQSDLFPIQKMSRPLRCTGTAISAAISLLENTFLGLSARILTFMSGPPTFGPGLIISPQFKESIRTHNELSNENAPLVYPATKFYEKWANCVATNGHGIDIFSSSMNQTGLVEMQSLCKRTGGLMVLADGFNTQVFQKSLQKLFEKDDQGCLKMAFTGVMKVIVSKPALVSGCIGNMLALPGDEKMAADNPIGSGTNCWSLPTFDPSSTYAIFFQLQQVPSSDEKRGVQSMIRSAANTTSSLISMKRTNQSNVIAPSNQDMSNYPNGRQIFMQFQVSYRHASGSHVVRVTTVAHNMLQPNVAPSLIIPGFDQECAAALTARLTIYNNEKQDACTVAFIDQQLVRTMKRFSTWVKDVPSSVQIPNEMSLYPQFMYYFRRGPLIQVFNNTPDESVYFRHCLNRECVNNILVMLQPTLDSYTLENDPVPVFLSASSVTPNNILLLDTFFHIVIHVGSVIAQWRDAGYHQNPDYENLKELLLLPIADGQALMANRLPFPIYVECDQNTSQSRFLIATLDPEVSNYKSSQSISASNAGIARRLLGTTGLGKTNGHAMVSEINPSSSDRSANQIILTEDASLQVFMKKLLVLISNES